METPLPSDGIYFLKRNPLFGQLGEDVLQHLARVLKPHKLDKGALLFREGEPTEALYLIHNGRLRIVSKSKNGEEKTVAYLGRGDAIGEMALLTSEPHVFSGVADTHCELLVLNKTDFDSVVEAHPLIGLHLSRLLSRRLAVSFHAPENKPKDPLTVALLPALPHETTLLFTVNLSIALAEQTRRKVVLLDIGSRSGDLAQSLGLKISTLPDNLFEGQDVPDIASLRLAMAVHPSGFEILSLHPRLFRNDQLQLIPPLLTILRDQYDFTLVLCAPEKDPITEIVLRECQKAFLVSWEQESDLAHASRIALGSWLDKVSLTHILLHHPSSPGMTAADFRVPWLESFHHPFRSTGAPYLSSEQALGALASLERIARALGKLRVGLAMGSGAAYGYSLVGILKVFEREGIPVDLVSGTSMGSLIGAFFCAGNSPERIREIAKGITRRWLFENMFGDLTFPHSGFMAGNTLSAFLRRILGNIEFHQLAIPFAAVATDIRSGHEVVLKEGRVYEAVRASTSLPIVFDPFLHKGRYLVDGGLVNPVPTSTVANMGADILVSVNLTAKPSVRRGLGRFRSNLPLIPKTPAMTEVFFKMIYTMQYEIAQARTEIAHVVLAPDMRDYLWTDFHRSEDILKVGEGAAEEAISKIKSLLPFFSDYCKVPSGISLRTY